jgi:hypothetical protein
LPKYLSADALARLQGAVLASWIFVMAGVLRYELCKEVNI